MAINPIRFPEPLVEGVVQMRKNSSNMMVQLGNEIVTCRSPTMWHIGNLEVSGRPCLLSRNAGVSCKTPFTVEAVSLDTPETKEKKWIGINLMAVDRYVKYYLELGGFPQMVEQSSMIHRRRLSGKSHLDFIVGNTAIAVQSSLLTLGIDVPEEMRARKEKQFLPTERFMKRIRYLRESMPGSKRIILLVAYLYDRSDFHISELREHYDEILPVVELSKALGLENWQANFIVTKDFVYLDRYIPLSIEE